jgi:hypothetical protein
MCPDKSGSASFTNEGFLKCHQCGCKHDLFDWVAKKDSIQVWDAMIMVAEMVGVQIVPPKKVGKAPREMSKEALAKSTHMLWSSETAEPLRAFLKARKLDDPQTLERFGVGYTAGTISFAQFNPDGSLRGRYRKYTPAGKRWGWSTGKGAAVGFWPYCKVPKDAVIWILEGEWDVLTAWIVLRLQDQGIYCFTWTGGAGAPVPSHAIPQAWKRHEVHVCYDNDTFQGEHWDDHYAPSEADRLAMLRRRNNLIHGVAGAFDSVNCAVRIRAIPIPASELWGADLRDWVGQGGRDISELTVFPFHKVKKDRPKPVDCTFNEVFAMAGKDVRFKAIVNTVEADGISVPEFSTIECAMGTRPQCQGCGVMSDFQNQVIQWSSYGEDLAAALTERNPERWILQNVVGKPGACPRARIKHAKYKVGCRWNAVQDNPEESGDKELTIVSFKVPTLSGEIEVEGTVYLHGTSPLVFAHKLRELDRADIDMATYATKFAALCPTSVDDTDAIDRYLVGRAHDLSVNVTHIYGREELHIGFDLLAHSVVWMKPDHHQIRGYLDIAYIGDTRAGKSMVARRMVEHYGIGEVHTCMENISRAGLTMGGATQGAKNKLKPGLFPRCHRKLLCLDEAHVMVEKSKDNPILHLQSARDVGTVGGVKIYGSRTIAAAVRLNAIFNWGKGNVYSFQFPCQHLLYLYGAPESVSRMDFAIAVIGDPDPRPEPVEHKWTSELTKVLALRAWGMTEDMVHFDEGVVEHADQICEDWAGVYSEELPLYTRKEKPYSILRIAIAIANLCFSHPEGKYDHCLVRKVHVQWAAQWLERTWAMLGYDRYSSKVLSTVEITKPFNVERMLTTKLGIEDHDNGVRAFPEFFGFNSKPKLGALTGLEQHELDSWLSSMVGMGCFTLARHENGYNIDIRLTKGGHQIIQNLYVLCSEYPEEYAARYQKIKAWPGIGDPGVAPLTVPTHILKQEWNSRYGDSDGNTNISAGPGSRA